MSNLPWYLVFALGGLFFMFVLPMLMNMLSGLTGSIGQQPASRGA